MLRIFVFSLLLANILLIALRLMQPDSGGSAAPVQVDAASNKLPTIELAENLPGTENSNEASAPGLPAQISAGELKEEATRALDVSEMASTPIEQRSMACIEVGPFENENAMAELKAKLVELFDWVQSREKQSIVDKGFWVYLPQFPSRAQAEQVARDISAAGVSELYIVPDGSMVNAISLGVYGRRERAEQRRQQLTNLGLTFDFMIEPQSEIESSYWLEAGPVSALNPTLIELSYNHPDIQQKQVDCSGGEPRQAPGIARENPGADAEPVEVGETN